MLEIIKDENIMKSEEFLNDADCILADIKIEDTKFNRRIIREIDKGNFWSSKFFIDRCGCKLPLECLSTTAKILLGLQYEKRIVNGLELGLNAGELLIQEPTGRIYIPEQRIRFFTYWYPQSIDVKIDGHRFYTYDDFWIYLEEEY